MKNRYVFLLSVGVGIIALIIYSYFGKAEKRRNDVPVVIADNFDPGKAPSESLKGVIASMSGSVSWISRVAEKAVPIVSSRQIQQGEEIDTGNDGNIAVNFQDACSIRIFPESGINFAQTMPANIVIEQKIGSVDYIKSGRVPVSSRALSLLVEINGEAKVAVDRDKQTVSVAVKSGAARAAYNDLENVSNIVEITEGKSLVFQNDNKKVQIRP